MKTPLSSTLAVLCAAGLALPAHAGIDVSIAAEIRLGKVLPPPPPEFVIVEPVGPKGPPPWAPASGFRRNRDYYYYPAAGVYFRPADRVWFYLDGGNWRFGASLPSSIRIDFDRCVSLTMETDKPFEYHNRVAEYYPGNFFTRVQIKEKGAKGPKHERGDDRGNDDHPGKGKGKDKGKGKGPKS